MRVVEAAAAVLSAGLLLAGCGTGSAGGTAGGGRHTPSTAGSTSSTAGPPPGGTREPPPTVEAAPGKEGPPDADLDAAPAAIRARADVPVLAYHEIRNWTAGDSTEARPYIMPPRTFRSQMDYLAEHGYHSVTPDRLLAHLTTGAPLPAKPVLLTFDDTDESQWRAALPVLKAHRFTATFFVMTVVLNKKNYMTDAQVRALDRDGMTIGGHTWDHHRVDRYSGRDWRVQITQPTHRLARILGHPVRYFAYPYGTWKRAAFPHLEAAGYWAAFQLDQKPVDRSAPLYTLQRQIANPYWTTAQFADHLSGGS